MCASRSTLTLAGNGEECWKLTRPLSQHAALIEAACFGATLREAARHKLEADMLDAGGIGCITTCLSRAALAGLASFSQQLLEQLTLLIAGKSIRRNGPGTGSAICLMAVG